MNEENEKENETLRIYQNIYRKTILNEINFENILNKRLKDMYVKYQKPGCCNTPKSLLIFSIFIIIFNCGGIFFAISRNEGYKSYKEILDKNLTELDLHFPNDNETLKLIEFLNYKEKDENECPYIKYSLSICSLDEYKEYCTEKRFNNKECNYMDHEIYNGNTPFNCDLTNYKSEKCSLIQYLDYQKKTSNEPVIKDDIEISYKNNGTNIEISYLRGFTFEKIWCKIGDYDLKILIFFLITMLLFIILLIYDLLLKKDGLTYGIKYYIDIALYLFFFIVFRIYIILFFALMIYSILVSISSPRTDNTIMETDKIYFFELFNIYDNNDSYTQLWKEKRIYAFVFCGIVIILFIFVCILSSYEKLIYNYFSFKFEENKNNEIMRKSSINDGNQNYEFEIKNNSSILLMHKQEKEKDDLKDEFKNILIFNEIVYNNENCYLNCTNKYISDQLGWIEFNNYSKINEGFTKYLSFFNVIFIFLFFSIYLLILNIKDEITYKYFNHIIDLGYKPKYYQFNKNYGNLQSIFIKVMIYVYLVIEILIIFAIFKRAFFGGFTNINITKIFFIISIILLIINFGFIILSVILYIFNLFTFIFYPSINFVHDNMLEIKLYIIQYFSYFLFVFILAIFVFNCSLVSYFNKVINENKELIYQKSKKEDKIKFISLNNENYIFEVIDSNNFPKKLFYTKKKDENNTTNYNAIIPPITQTTNKSLCVEMMQEDILTEEQKRDLIEYKSIISIEKGIKGRIIYFIILTSVTCLFIIAALSTLLKNYKYYKDYRDFLLNMIDYSPLILEGDNPFYNSALNSMANKDSKMPTFTRLWCYGGKIESQILISYFVFIILFLGYEIFSYLIHKNIIRLDIKKGIFYYIIICINCSFYVIFMIYFPLLLLLFIYLVIVLATSPINIDYKSFDKLFVDSSVEELENLWNKKKILPIVNSILILIIFFLNIKHTKIKLMIINYLNLNYDDNEEDENNENIENNEKETSIILKDNKYNVKIKLNKIMYLKEIGTGKIYKFKKILIENITNNFIYIKLGNNIITEIISLADWQYPDLNEYFLSICSLGKYIYAILFILIFYFKFQIVDEINYYFHIYSDSVNRGMKYVLNKEKISVYDKIFIFYGGFQKGSSIGRFIFNIFYIIILFSIMLERMFFGRFINKKYSLIEFIFFLYFSIQYSSVIILSFLDILFTIFSIFSYYMSYIHLDDNMIPAELFISIPINIIILGLSIKILVENIKFTLNSRNFGEQLIKFKNGENNEQENQVYQSEFKYIDLDGNILSLTEFQNENLQRNLYYNNINNEIPKYTNLLVSQLNSKDNINNIIKVNEGTNENSIRSQEALILNKKN